MKLALVISALAVALTGCGGGGGSGSSTTGSSNISAASFLSSTNADSTSHPFIPSLAQGDFQGNGSHYVVLSGWINGTTVPKVKIYKLTDTSATDATVDILGTDFALSVHYPQVADFNKDGIDDIFFPGFTDGNWSTEFNQSVVFISRAGQSHLRVDLAGLTSSHGSAVLDIDGDGYLDVANSQGDYWFNNQLGGFTYRAHDTMQTWTGSGLCSGDLDNSGATSIVVTDVDTGALFFNDNWIYKLDGSLKPVRVATLPVPYFDKTSTTTERSHDVSCTIGDLNNDGLLDIVVVSYLNDTAITNVSGPQSYVQIYINQGNLTFTETTDTAIAGYNQNTLASYTPKLIDLNNDGKLDLWFMNTNSTVSSSGIAESANQAWINSGSGVFTQTKRTYLNTVVQAYNLLSGSNSNTAGIMIPVKIGNVWNFAISNSWSNGALTLTYFGYAKSQLTF